MREFRKFTNFLTEYKTIQKVSAFLYTIQQQSIRNAIYNSNKNINHFGSY